MKISQHLFQMVRDLFQISDLMHPHCILFLQAHIQDLDKGEKFISKQEAGYTWTLYWCVIQYMFVHIAEGLLLLRGASRFELQKSCNRYLFVWAALNKLVGAHA